MDPIILASASPRRQEILKKLNIPFVINPSEFDESSVQDAKPDELAEYLAIKKVNDVVKRLSQNTEVGWVLGADTVVIHKNRVLGKPKDIEEARNFIKMLQGGSHKVVTGVALYNGKIHDYTSRSSINKVTFTKMTEKEIDWYLETGEWHGAAGGYRIQGKASCFISKIEGTESSVMGLPIFELYDMLREQNYEYIG